MSTVAILAAGEYPRKEFPRYLLASADHLVCCDSALRTALAHGLAPEAVIGDMDSLPASVLRRFSGNAVKVEEQDDNDLTKAFRYVLETYPDVDAVHILGATGKSEAHTLGNMSLLMEYEATFHASERGISVDMVSDYSTIFAVCNSCSLQVGEGRKVSIISPDNSLRIKSKGLHWKTDDVVFDLWWRATLNRADTDAISLEFSHPSLALVVLD